MSVGLIAVSLFVGAAQNSNGIAPPFISDKELAEYPIVVVGKWEKAPFESHNRYRDDVVTAVEAYTKLHVVRVIKGGIQPGIHDLMVGYGVSWSKEGGNVTSGTSTELPGEVTNTTEENLWFLKLTKSWDESRKTEYLSISSYREIQPTGLEDFFRAVGAVNADGNIPGLLSSTNATVVLRTLRFVCGGRLPWPYNDTFLDAYLSPQQPDKLAKSHADSVRKVAEGRMDESTRAMAAAVYSELVGKNASELQKQLLGDKSPDVRAVAVAVLARYRDVGAIPRMTEAVAGITNAWLSCVTIKTMFAWRDVRLVPALISFLENGGFAGQIGDDVHIPALKAKGALYSITGLWFPFVVAPSLQAWEQVREIRDLPQRTQRFQQLLPHDPFPIRAELIGTGTTNAVCRVKNVSAFPATITKLPTSCNQRWPSGISGAGFSRRGAEEFLKLLPGESTDFDLVLSSSFLLTEPGTRKLQLEYHNTGSSANLTAWIGTVPVTFGREWKEQRKSEEIEETWPNGNLKAKGRTVNGHNVGSWQFFNEEGDRIKTIDYSRGGSGVCNPDHPDNKGAGKRPKAP